MRGAACWHWDGVLTTVALRFAFLSGCLPTRVVAERCTSLCCLFSPCPCLQLGNTALHYAATCKVMTPVASGGPVDASAALRHLVSVGALLNARNRADQSPIQTCKAGAATLGRRGPDGGISCEIFHGEHVLRALRQTVSAFQEATARARTFLLNAYAGHPRWWKVSDTEEARGREYWFGKIMLVLVLKKPKAL